MFNIYDMVFNMGATCAKPIHLYFKHSICMCVCHDTQNKQKLLSQTQLSGWFLKWNRAFFFNTWCRISPIPVAARSKVWVFGHPCWNCWFESRRGHVSVVCFQVEVSASSWSLIQMSPTECGAFESDGSVTRRTWPTGAGGGGSCALRNRITTHSEILAVNASLRRLTGIAPSLSKPEHFVKKYLTLKFISARRRISEMQRINMGLLLLVSPAVSYGAEAWTLTKKDEQALLIFWKENI